MLTVARLTTALILTLQQIGGLKLLKMATSFEKLFKPVLCKGNPIREIGFKADSISEISGIPVIRLHLGNPSTPQFPETKAAMIQSVNTRISGYGPHPGVSHRITHRISPYPTVSPFRKIRIGRVFQ